MLNVIMAIFMNIIMLMFTILNVIVGLSVIVLTVKMLLFWMELCSLLLCWVSLHWVLSIYVCITIHNVLASICCNNVLWKIKSFKPPNNDTMKRPNLLMTISATSIFCFVFLISFMKNTYCLFQIKFITDEFLSTHY